MKFWNWPHFNIWLYMQFKVSQDASCGVLVFLILKGNNADYISYSIQLQGMKTGMTFIVLWLKCFQILSISLDITMHFNFVGSALHSFKYLKSYISFQVFSVKKIQTIQIQQSMRTLNLSWIKRQMFWKKCKCTIAVKTRAPYMWQLVSDKTSENYTACVIRIYIVIAFILVWGFTSHSRIFHSYGVVSITGEELQIVIYTRHSWLMSSEGYLACHTYCDTGYSLIMAIHKVEVVLYISVPHWDKIYDFSDLLNLYYWVINTDFFSFSNFFFLMKNEFVCLL